MKSDKTTDVKITVNEKAFVASVPEAEETRKANPPIMPMLFMQRSRKSKILSPIS